MIEFIAGLTVGTTCAGLAARYVVDTVVRRRFERRVADFIEQEEAGRARDGLRPRKPAFVDANGRVVHD